MVNRIEKLSKNDCLFLFGARGTGKTTLIRSLFGGKETLWIDLLTEQDEDTFGRNPAALSQVLAENQYKYVVIDEIQKFPKLLDIVHLEIEKRKKASYFILTGSSARKLKRNQSNLLGGRALHFTLHPYTKFELQDQFNLQSVLEFGSLPVFFEKDKERKADYLRGYIKNYLKEEILLEQIVRQVEPFRDFIEIAAQSNGQIINYSKIARDVGVSDQTIKVFYQILEETLIGLFLPSFHRSIRKRQREAPKFYFFDLGVTRAAAKQLTLPLLPGTSPYELAFEHFVILEIFRLIEYKKNDFQMSYLRTKDDAEIDLIIERPGKPDYLIEIKSTDSVTADDCRTLEKFAPSWDRPCQPVVWSRDPLSKKIGSIRCISWEVGLAELFEYK